ncbi:MAG TPA: Tn3 family transposase [Oculatellaceae cyanobacterium]
MAATSLLDIVKEADLRLRFTEEFETVASREVLDRNIIQRRLLLAIHGLDINAGLKRASAGEKYHELRYIQRRFVTREAYQNALVHGGSRD